MLVGAICWLALISELVSAQRITNSLRWTANIVQVPERAFLCDATLITYNSAVTTCECATHTDFIFPEFLKKKPLEYNLTTRRSYGANAYQSRRIAQFVLHPKCTSNNMITGFFSYNYAVAHTDEPFNGEDKTIIPIDLPALDYRIVNFTLWKALEESPSRCQISAWDGDTLYSLSVTYAVGCEEKLCAHLGKACPLSLEEKGLLCLKLTDSYSHDLSDFNERDRNWADDSSCTKSVLSGSPLVCYGFIMGVVAPGLCTLEVPVIVARIEPTMEFIYQQIETGMRSTAVVFRPLMTIELTFLQLILRF